MNKLTRHAIAALRNRASLTLGIEDPRLPLQTTTNASTLDALIADFN